MDPDNPKSPLYIDPFRCPSDADIKKKWDSWKKEDGPCKTSAIKWLQCMGLVKEFYQVQGGNIRDGNLWHKFMFDKCYAPYTDYKGCILDQRQAHMERLRAHYGEEKWKNSEEMVTTTLAEMVGHENAQGMWEYTLAQNARFKALRKAVDEERGVVRAGMKIPDFETTPELPSAREMTTTTKTTLEETKHVVVPEDGGKPSWNVKGWWSEPESRFKKPGEST